MADIGSETNGRKCIGVGVRDLALSGGRFFVRVFDELDDWGLYY